MGTDMTSKKTIDMVFTPHQIPAEQTAFDVASAVLSDQKYRADKDNPVDIDPNQDNLAVYRDGNKLCDHQIILTQEKNQPGQVTVSVTGKGLEEHGRPGSQGEYNNIAHLLGHFLGGVGKVRYE